MAILIHSGFFAQTLIYPSFPAPILKLLMRDKAGLPRVLSGHDLSRNPATLISHLLENPGFPPPLIIPGQALEAFGNDEKSVAVVLR